jgi:hypothetical protein
VLGAASSRTGEEPWVLNLGSIGECEVGSQTQISTHHLFGRDRNFGNFVLWLIELHDQGDVPFTRGCAVQRCTLGLSFDGLRVSLLRGNSRRLRDK